ncbi:nuclear transport factor 2 family protein [Pseudomonas sp. ZM23]|uniref:Nuclear transport factor 2 family protein n=1 Tax=Pseudomonas triclosanedens TaxID=2961893 RepID=A0ABY7A168_9PSED|nr:nuclear transport factor 2 family protein [Pseudomonas triclosanedens]MCP8464662.1 nuclear transport factor 2 family protein [Pseudomonas triclosanedens]MCP8473593.1 nuclear transport factor 2 family protein [Pseudomonas triclosanedens]MCP8478430.1 nuclear transport factor 2 family protein [Pseudomonas triclosanedens]WAI50858.1 nuclear transport factor 2 family protein [Pseudomonas triclosanedens]
MTSADDTELHALLDSWLSAVLAADVAAITSHYSRDILAFDAVKQLQFKGVEAYGRHWEECMRMCTEHTFEIHELSFEAGSDIAFGHYLAYCGGTDEKGQRNASWARVTVCLRREEGQWKIAHEHFSIPFDPATGQLLFDARP